MSSRQRRRSRAASSCSVGNVNGGERAGAIEDGELAGIAAVGFDAIAGATGNQATGAMTSHGMLVRGQGSLQLEATRPGFVAALDRTRASQALDEAEDRRDCRTSGVCSAGVRWPGSNTAATVVAAC